MNTAKPRSGAPQSDAATEVLTMLTSARIVPVLVVDDASAAAPLAAALKRGGLPIAEVTFRTDAAEDVLRELAADPELLVGAGTVITPAQVDRAVACGAKFIMSPGYCRSVAERARSLEVLFIPGVATPSDIIAALSDGIDVVKLFPAAQLGGPGSVNALAGPFPDVRFLPTGGVSAANALEYLAHPSVVAVGGSWMVPKEALRSKDFDLIAMLCAEAVDFVRGDR